MSVSVGAVVAQAQNLGGKTPQMVQKEIAAHLLGYNLIRTAMAQAASAAMSLPRQLSFASGRRAVAALHEQVRHNPLGNYTLTRDTLLLRIACARLTVPTASSLLVAIVKKELQLDTPLYTLLEILSVTVFEKTALQQALAGIAAGTETTTFDNQMNLFTI